MDWINVVLGASQIYLAIWIAKSMLLLADVHVAAGVAHRITGRPMSLLLLSMVSMILLITLLTWPKQLMTERWRFFLAYSRFSVIRQVLEAYRDAQANSLDEVA